jgi:hypothetical protein
MNKFNFINIYISIHYNQRNNYINLIFLLTTQIIPKNKILSFFGIKIVVNEKNFYNFVS